VQEMGDREWYMGKAIINLQQAVGRGMRSKDDWCCTYLLDKSFKYLLKEYDYLCETWFLESIDCYTELDVYKSESKFTFSE
jgi:hypothetical protein